MMAPANRMKAYGAFAADPCAALGGIAVETHAAPGGGNVPVTAQLQGTASFLSVDVFTAADLRFQAFLFSAGSSSRSGGGCSFFSGSRVIPLAMWESGFSIPPRRSFPGLRLAATGQAADTADKTSSPSLHLPPT